MESNDLDKLFQNAFEHAEQTPSEHVWKGIEEQLAQKKKTVPFYKKHITTVSIAAALLLIMGITLKVYKHKDNKESIQLTSMPVESSKETTISSNKLKISTKHTSEDLTIENDKQSNHFLNTEQHKQKQQAVYYAKSEKKDIEKETEKHKIESFKEFQNTTEMMAHVSIENAIEIAPEEDMKTLVSNKINPLPVEFKNKETVKKNKETLFTTILNTISKTINIEESKELEFKSDEEGSISINILETLAKK